MKLGVDDSLFMHRNIVHLHNKPSVLTLEDSKPWLVTTWVAESPVRQLTPNPLPSFFVIRASAEALPNNQQAHEFIHRALIDTSVADWQVSIY